MQGYNPGMEDPHVAQADHEYMVGLTYFHAWAIDTPRARSYRRGEEDEPRHTRSLWCDVSLRDESISRGTGRRRRAQQVVTDGILTLDNARRVDRDRTVRTDGRSDQLAGCDRAVVIGMAPGNTAATVPMRSATLWPNIVIPTIAIKATPAMIKAYSTIPWPLRLRINFLMTILLK